MREGNTHDGLGACCLIRLKVENFYNQIVLCQKQEGVYWKSLSPWSKTVQPPGPSGFLGFDHSDQRTLDTEGVLNSSRAQMSNSKPHTSALSQLPYKQQGVSVHGKSFQMCPTLCNPMDYSSPGSSVHGILQARILEGVATSFSRGSPPPSDWTHIS